MFLQLVTLLSAFNGAFYNSGIGTGRSPVYEYADFTEQNAILPNQVNTARITSFYNYGDFEVLFDSTYYFQGFSMKMTIDDVTYSDVVVCYYDYNTQNMEINYNFPSMNFLMDVSIAFPATGNATVWKTGGINLIPGYQHRDFLPVQNYNANMLNLAPSFAFYFTYLDESIYNSFNNNTDNAYITGYNQGYNEGYSQGENYGVIEYTNSEEFSDYVQSQVDTAYSSGFNAGYNDGISTQTYTFTQLFGAIADTPIMIMRNLLGFEVFGVDAMSIVMSMLTGCIVIYLIKRIIL